MVLSTSPIAVSVIVPDLCETEQAKKAVAPSERRFYYQSRSLKLGKKLPLFRHLVALVKYQLQPLR
jgi:hypothetical protein